MRASSNIASRSKNENKGHSYSTNSTNSMNSGSDSDRGGGHSRQSASASTESHNKNSMYANMKSYYSKYDENNYIYQNQYSNEPSPSSSSSNVAPVKTKKVAPQSSRPESSRPTTPHGNKPTNFIERNKNTIGSKKSKDDLISQNHSTKQQQSQRSLANGQSSARTLARPVSPKLDKKKSALSNGSSVQKVTSSSVRRAASPPATTSHHASAHSRSHVRADSPDSALREENKRLKILVNKQKAELRMKDELLKEMLKDKELELREAEDVMDSLRERNQKLQRLLEAEKQASNNSPIGILSAIMSDHQRILDVHSDSTPTPTSLSSLIGTNNNNPSPVARSPKTPTPAAVTTKNKELNKVNYSVRNVAPVASSVKPHVSSPKLTAQTPKRVERADLSPLPISRPSGPLDKRVNGNMVYAKKTAADLNVVMESDESEVDEFPFENDTDDDSSDNSTDDDSTEDDSESASTDDNDEECDEDDEDEHHLDDDGSTRNHSQSVDNRDDGDDVDGFPRHDLNGIVEEEDDEDEDDEFELDPSHQEMLRQKKSSFKNGLAFNTSSATDRNSPNNHVQRRLRRNHGNSSSPHKEHQSTTTTNSKTVSASVLPDQNGSTILNGQSVYSSYPPLMVNGNVSTQNDQPRLNARFQNISTKDLNSDVSSVSIKDYPHRDSMSSVASDSSDSTAFSKNGSYSSPATSPSSTRTDSEPSSVNASPLVFSSHAYGNVSDSNQNGLNSSSSAHQNGQAINSNSTQTSYDDQYPTSYSHHAGRLLNLKRSADQSNNSVSASHNYGNGSPDSITKSGKQLSDSTSVLNSSSQSTDSYHASSQNLVSAPPSTSRNNRYSQNIRRTPSPASSTRASTPNTNASTVRAQSPASSSRSSTPASESSRFTTGQPRRTRLHESSNYNNADSSSDINFVQPPPPPPSTKDPVVTLQHYLRLISSQCVQGKHCPQEVYDLRKVIDEGSSAKVYTARPMANRKEELAVKVVPLTYNLEFIFNELYVLKNFKHKNIVDFKESLLRWDGKNREVWIAMEKCARGDVTSRAGKIAEREVSRIAKELLEALKHIHSHGIIHRDIKLSNILAGANNEIKLADFGISSLTPTSTTSMVGTIPYMAPDVVLVSQDRPYDTKVDVWSLGVCILELLSGKAAWGRIRDDEIMDRLRRGEMPCGFQRLVDKVEIGWEVKDFLEKCFASNANDRWSAERLLEHPFITNNLY